MNRKKFITTLSLLAISTQVFPSGLIKLFNNQGNFYKIYSNKLLRNKFYYFLKNIFHLFPEKDFHILIAKKTKDKTSDQEIYMEIQKELYTITPFLSVINYQLPALMKQKTEMAKQSLSLLGMGSKFNGYLEIGSSGRYLDYLSRNIHIKGNKYYADGKKPGYSVTEMIDRGNILVGAEYIPFTDYHTIYTDFIKKNSLELVTVYIGFHHCPIDLREQFIGSIRDTLKPGGKLILRDHDCSTEDQKTLVALAHDVFNMGTNESWDYNHNEIRNFYSLEFICEFVEKVGFKFESRKLYQEGDPTKNALMLFTKT